MSLTDRLKRLGPGLVTGAADDDPSGIATYSQAGAQFGTGLMWTMTLAYPLMVAVQLASARVGRVTGDGLARGLKQVMPRWLVILLIALLFVANTINIGADLAAMGEASALVVGGGSHVFTIGFALLSLLLQLYVPYHRYSSWLKWLTLVLLAYVALLLIVKVDWAAAARGLVVPSIAGRGAVTTIVAIFGTTISPYLFFWQAAQEVEELDQVEEREPLTEQRAQADDALRRIRWDTLAGMAVSNIVALAIILGTATTLHAAGKTDIQSASDAAQALKPLAGSLAFITFSLGIIGTGLLAVPVLAGASGYAVARQPGAQAAPGDRLLFGDRARHGAGRRDRLVADQPDEGAVLERGHQRGGSGADHGRPDARRLPARHHEGVRRATFAALLRLAGDAGDGRGGDRDDRAAGLTEGAAA